MRLFFPASFPLLLLLALPVSSAASQFVTTAYYEISVEKDSALVDWRLNYSTELKNLRLSLTFQLPANATMLSVSDSLGTISDYQLAPAEDGTEVSLTARNGPSGGPIALDIRYLIASFAQQKYGRLAVSSPLCTALTDYSSADVRLPSDAILLSSTPNAQYGSSTAHFGSLADCITLAYMRGSSFEGEDGYFHFPTQKYDIFARDLGAGKRSEVEDASRLYNALQVMTGLEGAYDKWVVVVVPEEKLSVKGEVGVYRDSGLIFLKENAEENLAPILAHETIHGFNSVPLGWNRGESFWFEEGTANYAAHLFSLELGLEEPDFFVKGSAYYSTPYSDLARYYRTGNRTMESWNFSSLDDFSYDYSEFMMRAYVDTYGTDALRQAYACLSRISPDTRPGGYANRNELVLGCMSRAAGNASFESMLYPGKALFLSDEKAFERYAASIGSSKWRGVQKPLPQSAYDLPPLPYESEAKEALDSLSAKIAGLAPFSSQNAQELYQEALARYEQARSLYQAEDYKESLSSSSLASVLLEQALSIENAQGQAAPGQPSPSSAQKPPAQAGQPQQCLPALVLPALLALVLLASRRR